ncbi:MAG: SpoIIIAH-like family protein [Bacillota bacterium]|jgi:stage III sporulation protein AH|nr:SpoIIIAH-like family protein [Bacillota bacterium]
MFRTYNLRRSRLLGILLFAAIVAYLIWFVAYKRAEFLKGPVVAPPSPAGEAASKALRVPESDYFADSKVERERQRSQELERLREIAASPNTDAQVKKEAAQRLLSLTQEAAKESEVEHLVKARGYEDAVVFMGNGALVIVIRAQEITQLDVAKISDVVTRLIGIKPEAMRIIARR